MDLTQVFTRRNSSGQNYAQHIIYEWEDIIANELSIPIVRYPSFYKITNKMRVHIPFVCSCKNSFRFVVNGRDDDEPMNGKSIIPCVIDFFEDKNQLQVFYGKHSKNKIILFSSPFDFEYLKENNCPLNIGLFAYSLPDKYELSNININKGDQKIYGTSYHASNA